MAAADYEVIDGRFARLIVTPARVEQLFTGCRWAEGPAYFAAGRYLVWSDIPNDRQLRWDETSGVTGVFRYPAGYTNGNTVDRQGRLVSCEHGGRRISRTEIDGSVTTIADRYDGKRLNSPNDLVVKSDGSIWFTDPAYGIESDYEGHRAESEIGACHVYRVDPTTGEVRIAAGNFQRPNGIAFSPDERRLYVSDTGATHGPDGPRHIRVFDVGDGNVLRGGEVFATCTAGFFDGSGWTRMVESGPAPPTASTATTRTARCWGRCWCRSRSPTSVSAAPSGTGSSSAAPPRSTRSCSPSTARRRTEHSGHGGRNCRRGGT